MALNSSDFGPYTNTSSFICALEDTKLSRNLKIFAIGLVGGFGILNNVFIIVLALKYTVTKKLHHLIISMAVADIITVLTMPALKMPSILGPTLWYDIQMFSRGDGACKLLSFCVVTAMHASYTSLVIISIERFRASRRTLQMPTSYTMKQRLTVVSCSWLISGALASHEIPYRGIEDNYTGVYACKGLSKVPAGLRICYYTTLAVSFFCIIAVSSVTLRKLSHRQSIETSLPEVQRKARAKRTSGAIKMVLASLFLFSFCYIPFVVWDGPIKVFGKGTIGTNLIQCYDFYIFDFLKAFLTLLNCCFGPVIYLNFLPDFREAAKRFVYRISVNVNVVEP